MAAAATWAITVDGARAGAVAIAAIGLAVAALAVWLLEQILAKVVMLVLLVALVALVWSQRSSLDDCAARVTASLTDGAVDDSTCTFFGRDVTVTRPG